MATRIGQVRGVLAERVVVSVPLDPFLSLRAASQYLGLSIKTLRRAVNGPPDAALPCYRVGAVILVRRSEADAWMAQRRTVGRPSLVAAMRELGLAR
jgi:predicted DNA-binding transcriptional regulator AlpA